MPTYAIDSIIKTLSDVTDLQRILDEYQLSPPQILHALRSARGKRQIKARRQLAQIHSELVAHRFTPYAVHKLCQLLSDEKSELRLKGALSLLSVAGLGNRPGGKWQRSGHQKAGSGNAQDDFYPQTIEDVELLHAVAQTLAQRRAAKEAEKPPETRSKTE